MTELWDIARYVETHPEDFEQRWRLAKKLYKSWEYRLALEHLQILKNEWHRKLNVVRYLSATYYRLGRYSNAIEELRDAIKYWPDEVGLHEQLARVLEVDNQRDEAKKVWERVLALDGSHALAGSSIRRIAKSIETGSGTDDLGIQESDSGIDLSPGRVCPNCGAHNSDEHDRCWQCSTRLYLDALEPRTTPGPIRTRSSMLKSETTWLVTGLVVIGLMSLAIFLSFQNWSAASKAGANNMVIATVEDVLHYRTLGLRLWTGAVLLLAWPAALLFTVRALNLKVEFPESLLALGAAGAALLLFDFSFLPPFLFSLLSIGLAMGAIATLLWAFSQNRGKALQAGILHLTLLAVVVLSAIIIHERISLGILINPLTEISAVRAYTGATKGQENPGYHTLPMPAIKPGANQSKLQVMWQSTGSAWLDLRGRRVQFAVTLDASPEPGMRFQVTEKGDQGLEPGVIYPEVTEVNWSSKPVEIVAGKKYYVRLSGAGFNKGQVKVAAKGLLVPTFPKDALDLSSVLNP
ncbi:MAG: hypothetical protein HYV27_16360 [Candidatus Hydrogenedentes bacterium]|nr:hypothetical protein [Candidatus Hydrogenedentota bacterium]